MYRVKRTRNTQCLLQDILWLCQAVQCEMSDSKAHVHAMRYNCLA